MDSQHHSLLSGLKILVVDDNDDACKLVSLILELHCAEVTTVYSVSSALEQFEKGQPDLIISDIAMPGEDGYSLIRKVRARSDQGKQLPVIAMTAYSLEGSQREILEAGFQRCLGKPVEPEQLISAIVELIFGQEEVQQLAPGTFC